jgi:hypothetical protein
MNSRNMQLRVMLPGTPVVVDADGERMSERDIPAPNVYASATRFLFNAAKTHTLLRFHSVIEDDQRVDTLLERTTHEWQPYVVSYPKDAECPKAFQLCAIDHLVEFLNDLRVGDVDQTLLTHSMRAECTLNECDALNPAHSYHFRPVSASSDSETSVVADWPSRPSSPCASGRSCSLESSVSSMKSDDSVGE